MKRTTKQSRLRLNDGILDGILGNSRIPKPCVIPRLDRGISSQRILEFPIGILNFSGVLGAAAPKGLGRSPYKICGARGLPH